MPLVPHSTAICPVQVCLPGQGTERHGGVSTFNISEWPNDAAVCSLSQILEKGPIPQRFFLSAKACLGILRRAEKRGKELPEQLARALKAVAGSAPTSNRSEEHTSELQSLMRISYAVFCLKKTTQHTNTHDYT